MTRIFSSQSKKYLPFFAGLVLSVVLLWPLFAAPTFSYHDDVQYIRLYQMHKCFLDLQIPCRWVPDLGAGYGYPLFNYYAPLPYYVGEIFYLITGSLLISVKLMFAFSFLGAYVFMYLLARKLWGDWGGMLSAVFYSYAPYHAVDFYVRGAMGEMWGLMFMPAVAWSLVKLKEELSFRKGLLSAFLLACLILSHNLTAMLFIPVMVIELFILYLSINSVKKVKLRFLGLSIFAIILGLGLAAFYFLPAYFEKDLVHVDTTTVGYFSYTEHFKGLRKLVLDRSWDYGGSFREVPGGKDKDTLSYQIGWVHLLGWILALIVAFKLWKKDPKKSILILLISGLTLFSIFMIHPRSAPVWALFEPLKYLQFPWRFLMLIIFYISILSGSIVYFLKGVKYKNLNWGGLIILVMLLFGLNFFYFRPKGFLNLSDTELLSGSLWEYQLNRSILDYLPKSAKEPPAKVAPASYQILAGNAEVRNHHQGSNWFEFNVEAKDRTIIRISNYYFPEWKIFINGKDTDFEYKDNNLGLMSIILGEGKYHIEGRLYNTPIRNIANLISLISVSILLLLFVFTFPKIRRAIMYYVKAFR